MGFLRLNDPDRVKIVIESMFRQAGRLSKNPIWLFVFLLVFLGGCTRPTKDEQKADSELKGGRYESAINSYEKALNSGDRLSIHKKMAEIFLTQLHDPASAAYHYKRILELHPPNNIAEAARSALRHIGHSSLEPAPATAKADTTVKSSSPPAAFVEAEKQARAKVRTYQVQPGDTLSSISRKVYQSPNRWKDILDANQNQLSNPDELKPGQTIILP
jgi:nucleoid-associated protein YgaU